MAEDGASARATVTPRHVLPRHAPPAPRRRFSSCWLIPISKRSKAPVPALQRPLLASKLARFDASFDAGAAAAAAATAAPTAGAALAEARCEVRCAVGDQLRPSDQVLDSVSLCAGQSCCDAFCNGTRRFC